MPSGPSPTTEHAPADPLHPVRGRILLHVKSGCRAPLDHGSAKTGGVLFSGKGARNDIQQVTAKAGHDAPTILDRSAYEDAYAAAAEPLTLAQHHHHDTRRTGLGATLDLLTSSTADLVLSPTRYRRCDPEGARALEEAVRQTNTVDLPKVVLAVPIDARWL